MELQRIGRPSHVPDTQSQDRPVQSRVENPSERSKQQDVPISRSSTIPRRKLNVRNPWKEKCDKQMEKVLEVLRPIMSEVQTDSQRILLCCGKPDQCQIIPVKIPLSADSVIVWHEIQQAWNIYTGSWRRNIPFFGVRKVSVVDVNWFSMTLDTITLRLDLISIIDRTSKPPSNDTFIGFYEEEDFEASRQSLEHTIPAHEPYISLCKYDSATNRTCHSDDCVSQIDDESQCPLATVRSAKRSLSRLKMRTIVQTIMKTL